MIYVGIDPDLIKSGVGLWESRSKHLSICALTFFDLMEYIQVQKRFDPQLIVFLEAGWKNKVSNFHGGANKRISDSIARKVGENHAVGKLIEQFLIKEKIEYHLITPTSRKWSAEDFKRITGNTTRTNSEMRDAARLIFGR